MTAPRESAGLKAQLAGGTGDVTCLHGCDQCAQVDCLAPPVKRGRQAFLFALAAGVVGAVLLSGWFPKWSIYLLAVLAWLAWLGWMGSAVRDDRNGGGHR